jgi:hypothetical protein
MSGALQRIHSRPQHPPLVRHAVAGHPRRAAAEDFIRDVFRRRYEAEVPGFAPNLMLLEQAPRIVAAAGWRGAESEALMLEQYLDEPIEHAISRLAGQPVARGRIVEVGNLAAERPGGSVAVILALAAHLDQLGFEWVAFTATSELIGIFRRLDLPPLALAPADPQRLGEQAQAWGRYYDTRPVVVAGRLRLALEKGGSRG